MRLPVQQPAALRRFRPWRGIAFLAAVVVLSLGSSGVWAYWSAGSGTGGNGAASATSVGAGQTPTPSWSGTTVNLSWAASTLGTGTAVSGYIVKRYNATTLALQTILTSCNGTITGTSCTESNLPTGSWMYTVTPVFSTNWVGAESPKSQVVYTDPTPPVNNITISNIVGGAYLSGATVYYRGSVAGSFTVTNALTDADSGPASSSTSALGGLATGWTTVPSTVSSPTGGPYVSNSFTWLPGTTTSPTETITGRDRANNTAVTTGTLINDSTPPTGTISYGNSYQPGRFVTVTLVGSDSGSGLQSAQLQRQSANLRGGTCGAFGAWANIGAVNPVSPYTDSTVSNAKCYNYEYVLTDQVGNTFTATTSSTAITDYAGAVKNTSGVVDQLRLGDAAINGNTTAVDSVGSLKPTYTAGVTLGANGDPQNDPDTGVTLNGSTGWLQDKAPSGLPVGNASRSVEVWFKTKSALHQTLFTYGSYANGQEFGLWIDPDGGGLTTWGWGGAYDATFTTATTVDDGLWHQAVLTWDGTAIALYIDGSLVSSVKQTRNTVIDAAGLQIGDVNDATDPNTGFPFIGSLDEFSVYNVALTSTDVTNHFQLGANQGTDSTGPTGGSVAVAGLVGTNSLYSTSTTVNLALAKGTDSSGVSSSSAYLYRATASLTSAGNADGVCGSFGAFSLIAIDPSASYADSVSDGACYAYRYSVPDLLGNYSTYASGMVKVDTTAPSTPSLGFSGLTNVYVSGSNVYFNSNTSGGFTVTATASDPSSGIASYSFPTALGTGWTTTNPTLNSRRYSFVNSAVSPGTQTISVTNNAGTTSAAVNIIVAPDVTAPVASPPTYAATITAGPASITIGTVTDAGSGVKTVELQRASASETGTTCNAFGTFANLAAVTASSTYSDAGVAKKNCYQYQLVVTDNLGNQATTTPGAIIQVG